jgi:hypothetical protein
MKITRRAIKASRSIKAETLTTSNGTQFSLYDGADYGDKPSGYVLTPRAGWCQFIGEDNLRSLGFSEEDVQEIAEVGRAKIQKYRDDSQAYFNRLISEGTRSSKRTIKAARTETIQYLNFDELSDEQKDQAVKIFMESDTANRWFDDYMMDFYYDRVSEFAGALYDKTGIEVDTKKLYWGSSSQGPYPEWKLDEVLGDYDDNNGVSASFYGSLDAKFDTILIEEIGDFIATGNQEFYDTKEVRDAGMPEIADQLDEVLAAVQAFVDAVWSEVNDVCTSYPDEEWCYGVLESDNYEFRVDDAGNVVSMA